MSNLFDKQRFLDDLINCSESIGRKSLMVMIEVLKNQPAIEAEPVVHGEWKFHESDKHGNKKPYCSICGEYHLTSWSDYVRCKICPNCGAKMKGANDGWNN